MTPTFNPYRGFRHPAEVIGQVLLQTPDRVKLGDHGLLVQAATPNRLATRMACAFMSRLPTLCTCPFLIIAIAS